MSTTIEDRQIRRRLAILRHAEEVTGNVAMTCRYYGNSRQNFYVRKTGLRLPVRGSLALTTSCHAPPPRYRTCPRMAGIVTRSETRWLARRVGSTSADATESEPDLGGRGGSRTPDICLVRAAL